MVMHTCPRCGQSTDVPQIFSPLRQQIFRFIWDNPWCTNKEIIRAIYGRAIVNRRVIYAHLYRMSEILMDHGYRLDRRIIEGNHFSRGRPKVYRIIKLKKGEENAATNVATVLR